MIVVTEPTDLVAATNGVIAFVPTMGALHRGHASLITHARTLADTVVISVFVNPTQFGVGEDFDQYPSDLAADSVIAAQAGADVLFAPTAATIYPVGFATSVDPGPLADDLCGRSRPGHFSAVATVVTRLFGLVRPQTAVVGRKDYQQFVVLQRVVTDLALAVELVGVATVRDPDGLAISSRNRSLSAAQRAQALAIPATLHAIAMAYAAGARDVEALTEAGRSLLRDLDVEYLAFRDAGQLGPWNPAKTGVALIAARVGGTRLIDNIILEPAAPAFALQSLEPKELS